MKPETDDAEDPGWDEVGFGRMLMAVSGLAQSGEGRSCSRWALSRVTSCGLATRWGSGAAGRESWARSAPDGSTDRAGQSECPGRTRTRRACRQWVLGSGEEERRISAPNSIC